MDTKAYKEKKILVFAGTFEGHMLARVFSERGWLNRAVFCVATEYGSLTLSDIPGIDLREGRLSEAEMEALILKGGYGLVIDATHPYAAEVTFNIRAACDACGTAYTRLLRAEGIQHAEGITEAASVAEAAELLNRTEEKVLLTTGAKELHQYSGVKNLSERLVARVLPSEASLESCRSAGIAPKHIVAMQGPFTAEMNLATMRQYGCSVLVTKNTGKPGGFDDKLALLGEGYRLIVIGRPQEETGCTIEQVIERAEEFYG